MKNKILALSIVLMLTSICLIPISSVQAIGEGDWITKYTVENAQTKELLLEVDFTEDIDVQYSSILAGTTLKVTFTVKVTSGTGSLGLRTDMQKATGEDTFWRLISDDYELGSEYNPASASTKFNWEKGTFEMTCIGKVRQVTKATNVTLVELSSAGVVLDAIKPLVVTAAGSDFQNLYIQYEDRLRNLINSGVASGYTAMYSNMLNQSKALDRKGYTEEAIALLKAIPTSGEPLGSALEMILLPVMGVLAALAVVFLVLFLRIRGKVSYFTLVVEDQIKDLEGLTLRASKIDRAMSSNLESVKDRLKRLVGM